MNPRQKHALKLLMWVLDMLDEHNCHAKVLTSEQVTMLTYETMTRLLPSIDSDRNIPPPPETLTYMELLNEILAVPFNGGN